MLNLSYEKEFQLHYHKFDSVDEESKENHRRGWNRFDKSRSD